MSNFRIKQTSILEEINNRKTRIQVYVVEVQNKDARSAEKLLMKHEEEVQNKDTRLAEKY
jgi:hypothetical protein